MAERRVASLRAALDYDEASDTTEPTSAVEKTHGAFQVTPENYNSPKLLRA
jgi:hypothetical protein